MQYRKNEYKAEIMGLNGAITVIEWSLETTRTAIDRWTKTNSGQKLVPVYVTVMSRVSGEVETIWAKI